MLGLSTDLASQSFGAFAGSPWFVPATVALAGFVGSAHCVGMCGPLILSLARSPRALLGYHLARFCAYVLAGAIAGAFGQEVESFAPAWFVMTSMGVMGLLLIAIGIGQYGLFKNMHFQFPPLLARINQRVNRWVWPRAFSLRQKFPVVSAAMIGFLSVALPCGHLYAFLAGAVSTGNTWRGAGLMAAFAVGTWPALAFGLAMIQRRFSPLARSRFAGVCLVMAGLGSLGHFAWNWQAQIDVARIQSTESARALTCH